MTSFIDLNLVAPLIARLSDLGFHQPTPIQHNAIPTILKGSDLIAGANTGSGKTATFALPILQQLYLEKQAEQLSVKTAEKSGKGNNVSHLILVPTRELAQQVGNNINSYAAHFNGAVKIQTVFGGVSVNKQMQALRGGTDVLVATPGRLIDLISSNAIKLDLVKTLVLDEADRMLNLGFTEELTALLRKLPKKKQTLLFSATFPEQVEKLTKDLLQNPVKIQLQSHESSTLVQRVFTVNKGEKNRCFRTSH
jgi:superfamily II DNA/RNA helicase